MAGVEARPFWVFLKLLNPAIGENGCCVYEAQFLCGLDAMRYGGAQPAPSRGTTATSFGYDPSISAVWLEALLYSRL